MRKTAAEFWLDDGGFLISAELVFVATILVIGLVVGLVQLQSSVIHELTDIGCAIGALNQSFSLPGTQTFKGGHTIFTSGSFFKDNWDECDCNFGMSLFCTGPICGEGGFGGFGGVCGLGLGGGGFLSGGGFVGPVGGGTAYVAPAAPVAPAAVCPPGAAPCPPDAVCPPGATGTPGTLQAPTAVPQYQLPVYPTNPAGSPPSATPPTTSLYRK